MFAKIKDVLRTTIDLITDPVYKRGFYDGARWVREPQHYPWKPGYWWNKWEELKGMREEELQLQQEWEENRVMIKEWEELIKKERTYVESLAHTLQKAINGASKIMIVKHGAMTTIDKLPQDLNQILQTISKHVSNYE